MRYLIGLLALAGVVVSALALRVHYDTGTEPCSINEKWDCGIVNHSPYAEIAQVPVAAIGIAGYLALAGLALARRRASLAGLAVIGLGFALYLTNIERSVLQVWCGRRGALNGRYKVWAALPSSAAHVALINLNRNHVQGTIRTLDV
jgi:uncharacterized membrane protein